MKLESLTGSLVTSALLAFGLAGCAAARHGGDAHARMGKMDMQSMCEMHQTMMSGKSPAEQQALMQEHMKSMAPEKRQRMEAMHEQCR